MSVKEAEGRVRYRRNPDVVLRHEDGNEPILFNPETSHVVVLNETGLFLWTQSDGTRHVDELVSLVQNEFEDVPEDSVVPDVHRFVTEMAALGFLGLVGS